ncbi:MAG: hypothetical protein O2901_11205 [Verrucomicrobia bacterium]|nr:hypothetical protein [Verrucomicrobiota bacterium]
MSEAQLRQNPDDLMKPLRGGPSMMSLTLRSVMIHLVVILVSSLPYVFKCVRYGTLDVRAASAEERRVLEEEQRRTRREQGDRAVQTKKAPPKAVAVKAGPRPSPDSRRVTGSALEPIERAEPEDSNLNVDEDFGL